MHGPHRTLAPEHPSSLSRSFYVGGLERCRKELALEERRSLRVSSARLVTALGAIGLLVATVWGHLEGPGWLGTFACAFAFIQETKRERLWWET